MGQAPRRRLTMPRGHAVASTLAFRAWPRAAASSVFALLFALFLSKMAWGPGSMQPSPTFGTARWGDAIVARPGKRKCGRSPKLRLAAVSDPWQVLGVQQGASQAEIKRAYRRSALKYHPDVNKEVDAKERWQQLSEAYDVLSDPTKQRAWEAAKRQGSSPKASARRAGRTGATGPGPRQAAMDAEYDAGGDSFGSIFGDLLEGLGREVGGVGEGPIGKARKAGGYVLEELLDFLEGRSDAAGNVGQAFDGSRPKEELQFAREEQASLQHLDDTLRREAETWEQSAVAARDRGDSFSERDAMQKLFDARERRNKVRRRVLRASERVEYLEKVVFESEAKRQRREADSPGRYTIVHDRTKVASTLELSEKFVAELARGATVNVLEVVNLPKESRVRGRLESPVGWISLLNVATGYRWAKRTATTTAGGVYEAEPPRSKAPAFDADAALEELKSRRQRGR